MNYFTKTVYGDQWGFYLIDANDNTIADENAEAETDTESKEVYFRPEGVRMSTVKHEIFHVFFSYTLTNTANLDSLQTEEVCAEMYSYRDKQMAALSEEVLAELIKLRDSKDE